MNIIERQLQLCLNKIEKWATENGFKFSSSKTVGIHFCIKRGLHPDPGLKLYNFLIKIVPETKFVYLIFDSKLTFLPHIKMLKNKCLKALNILKCVSNIDWLGYGYYGFVKFILTVDSIKIGLRMYRLQYHSSILYQVAWYSSSSRTTTFTWSVQNVSNWAFVCWGKRAL